MKYRDQRSRRIFAFICHYTREHGFPPTMGEIAKDEGFKSNSGVIRHLDKLEKWGWIERYHGNARSIRILRPCDGAQARPGKPNSSRQYSRQR
ncbi:MAG: hypothetical protein OXG85_07700 [Chloroflexi bacterium]|nr:hypothetical protein [Chloroflexota bacterium]